MTFEISFSFDAKNIGAVFLTSLTSPMNRYAVGLFKIALFLVVNTGRVSEIPGPITDYDWDWRRG